MVVGILNYVCGNLREFELFNAIIIGPEETLMSALKRAFLGAIIIF